MAFKPNYNHQRAERNRAKAQKKQAKLQRLEEESAKRKSLREEQRISEQDPGSPQAPDSPHDSGGAQDPEPAKP